MKLKYFCLECKKNIDSGDALVVDDTCPGTFCSEECIEDFYGNQIKDFEAQEQKFRAEHGIMEYADSDTITEQLDDIFDNPEEVVHHTNSLNHSYFLYQKKITYLDAEWTAIVITLHADEIPSIVLFKTLTQDKKMIDFFMMSAGEGMMSDDKSFPLADGETTIKSNEEVELPEELLAWVEQKKSSILAEHLAEREDDDIDFEEFTDFESFLMPTLNDPDEIFVYQDTQGDDLYVYIKAHQKEDTSFYYFALCALPDWENKPDELDETQVFIPILTFPSISGDIYKKYSSGKKHTGKLKN